MEPIRLYGASEFAKALDISEATLKYWMKKYLIEPPYAVYGEVRESSLWTIEQVERGKRNYKMILDEKAEKAEKIKKLEKTPEPVIIESTEEDDEETLPVCSLCGFWVYNMEVHMDFAHKGKLTKVGAKQ